MQADRSPWNLPRSALLGFLLASIVALPAQAAVVDLATAPLFNTTSVKPNLLFLIDDSSSMDYNYLPDDVPRGEEPGDVASPANPNPQTDTHRVALTSSQCNGVAYNPAVTYSLPVDSDGNPKALPSFAAAPTDGFDASSSTTDLTGQFYYKYNGAQTPLSYTYTSGSVDTTTAFYQECNELPAAGSPYAATHFARITVGSGSGPGGADERQNYANWYSYYRTRMLMMKTLTGQSFQLLTSDYRVGFLATRDKGAMAAASFLPIDDFVRGNDPVTGDPLQKTKFYNTLYGTSVSAGDPQRNTPLRGALSMAGRYFGGKFYTGGTTAAEKLRDPMQFSCQQNFTLLASDGYWNSSDECCSTTPTAATNYGPFQLDNLTPVGNQDGGATLRPMLDAASGGSPNTLSDVAMYYYQTNLRNPGSGGNTCTSGATGKNLCPSTPNVPGNGNDNNPNPHMTTFTLGLAINGLLGYSPSYASDGIGDFFSIKTGGKNWPAPRTSSTATPLFYDGTLRKQVIERVDDLWHTAVNGRGSYLNAKDPVSLLTGLKSSLAGIATRLGYGAAGATSSLAPTATDNALYVASYTTGQWTGNLLAQSINPVTGAVVNAPAWCAEDLAADPLNGIPSSCSGTLKGQFTYTGSSPSRSTSDSRNIYHSTGGANPALESLSCGNKDDCSGLSGTIGGATVASFFDASKLNQWYTTFSATDKTTATPKTLVNYLRGHTQYMSIGATASLYRERKATLGDIVDSQPVFVGAPAAAFTDPGYTDFKADNSTRARTVLVGANDGMLHAFNAASPGAERWAYVPTPAIPNMYRLADTAYASNHRYYVNGRLGIFDVCVATDCRSATKTDWRTILIGGLNGGGRGFFAMDVTNPASPSLLWEFTSLDDPDLGYSFGNPLAVKVKDGDKWKWVVLVTSGYDNVKLNNGDPFDATGSGRGFLFVLNPLTGARLDKIDTGAGSTESPSGLNRIAVWADNPEQDATALYAYGGDLLGNLWRFDINTTDTSKQVVKLATFKIGNDLQPITTRPELTKVGVSRMVFVATGKYLEVSDLDSTKFKTQSLYAVVDGGTTISDPRGVLAQRTLASAPPIRTLTKDNKDPSAGWFVDFPDSGERSNVDMVLARGTLLVPTNVPTNDLICNAGGYSWLNYFDYATGGLVAGSSSAAVYFATDLTTGLNLVWINGTPEVIRTGTDSRPTPTVIPFTGGATASVKGHRVGWREIISK